MEPEMPFLSLYPRPKAPPLGSCASPLTMLSPLPLKGDTGWTHRKLQGDYGHEEKENSPRKGNEVS